MTAKEFNLLHEPWVLVLTPDGEQKELSLLEAFEQAPSLLGLAGELPTQDFAVLRLMLAILHAVVGRQMDGSYLPLGMAGNQPINPGFIKQRWHHLWQQGTLPLQEIKAYLKRYEDRFWLFHPVRPFYQVPSLEKGTEYEGSKLIGTQAESSNKKRLFNQRSGDSKTTLSYAEAVRWLLHLNAYDDTASKPVGKNLPSSGAGRLGRLGLIAARGNNLFETLMLNLVLLPNGEDRFWESENPTWVAEKAKVDERTPVVVPNNPSELLTLQSRRIVLKRKDAQVVGYTLIGGDFYPDNEELFAEQMTLWRKPGKNSTSKRTFEPKEHDPQRLFWRDFSAIVSAEEGLRRPGVVNWLAVLKADGFLRKKAFDFQIASVQYGDKYFFANDVYGDHLTFSAELLAEGGNAWVGCIMEALSTTEQMVAQVGYLAQGLLKAAGNTSTSGDAADKAKAQAYFRLDQPFRQWLRAIDPEEDDLAETKELWRNTAITLLSDLGRELVDQSGESAYIGRTLSENNTQRRYTSPEVYRAFIFKIKSL